ncbi:imidazole glycerol phosphate synthase subunit HisF [Fructilactobacillus frigidiflavus]|uniref:imidazole glycerol phosphate synthase subunit HisF n=1 Tax=Fructilactobacillus frigidiflavus TaxID=3242688 RepID=UPI0037564309
MLTKRIIPALDIKDGQVVKGTQFKNLQTIGDPVEIGKRYQAAGADELVFLDITATKDSHKTVLETLASVSQEIFIPLTAGGGIRSLTDIDEVMHAGVDKVFINSAAITNPELITAGADKYGKQAIVGAIDAKWDEAFQFYRVYRKGGIEPTNLNAATWAQTLTKLGAGELLVTSMDADGTKKGYDLKLYQELAQQVDVPIIASGGAGSVQDLVEVLQPGKADAALVASLFHYQQLSITEVKEALSEQGLVIRQ